MHRENSLIMFFLERESSILHTCKGQYLLAVTSFSFCLAVTIKGILAIFCSLCLRMTTEMGWAMKKLLVKLWRSCLLVTTQLLVVCERDSFIYLFCFDVVHILVLVIHVMFASYCSLVLSRHHHHHHHYHYFCHSYHAQDYILSISPKEESLHAPVKTSKRTHWSLFTLNFSLVIAWTLYNLAKYPEHQEKCRQEVDEVVGFNQDLDWWERN